MSKIRENPSLEHAIFTLYSQRSTPELISETCLYPTKPSISSNSNQVESVKHEHIRTLLCDLAVLCWDVSDEIFHLNGDKNNKYRQQKLTCSASLKESRPADSRTIVRGITTLAVAIMRPMSQISGALLSSSPNGVPSIETRAFIGTDSGCSGSVASVCSRPIRSFSPLIAISRLARTREMVHFRWKPPTASAPISSAHRKQVVKRIQQVYSAHGSFPSAPVHSKNMLALGVSQGSMANTQ